MRSPPADCLFIHVPRWESDRREIMVMPLGLPALANLIADETGHEPAILHLGIEREADPAFSLRSALSAHPPRLIFLSLHWYLQTRAVVDVAKRIRSWLPESTIVVGGLTATVFARELLEQLRFIDAVVCGDGEASVLALVRTMLGEPGSSPGTVRQTLHEVPNLLWRDAAGVLHDNAHRYCLDEGDAAKLRHGSLRLLRNRQAYLDRVLYADFSEGAREPGYARAAYLNGGRGCSVNCVNCGGGAAAQAVLCGRRGVLLYPLHKLVRDVEEAVAEGAQVLRMSFDPPAARRSLRAWFDALQGVGQPLRLVYDLWHLPSAELLDSMGKVFEPGSTLILSPECGSEQVRRRMRGLSFSNEQMLASIREIEFRGFGAHCFFSAGLPTETPEDIDASLALIDRIRSETSAGISVCPMVADPGSPLFLDPEAYGARLTRTSLRDFYEEKGIANGPGYETRFFTEREIVAACDRLLKAAGLPGLGSEDESGGPRVQRALADDASGSKRLLLLVGAFRSLVPEGSDGPFGSQGGFVDNLAPAPYSLANGYLKAWAEKFEDVRDRWALRLLNLAEPLELEDEREEVALSVQDVERIVAQAPHLVAFSTYCWNVDAILRASIELKTRLPGVRILLGGRATEGDPRELLASCPTIDAVVVGEGELPFLEILRRDSFDAIPGVYARSGEEIRCGGPPQSIQSLDEIPSPFLSGVIAPVTNAVMLEFSRGCLHACGYCTWNSDKHLRYFGAERIEREVAWAREQGHRHITMNDSALNYDTAQLRQFVEAVRRADPSGTVQFTYNVRHDALSDEQVGILSNLPTHMALMGIETLSDKGMGLVDRAGVDVPLLRDRLQAFARAVRSPVASIVLGLPNDDEHGFLETLDTLLSWTVPKDAGVRPVQTVLVSLLQVYQGSKLWQRREELGLHFCTTGIPYLIESPSWPAPSLARCKAEIIRRIAKDPERLKAAEALVLMDGSGVRPLWLSRRVLGIVLRDWPAGREHDGWTLERIGYMRDTGQGALLRFRRRDGGGARVRLTLEEDVVRAQRPGRYRIRVHALPGPLVSDGLLERLGQLVQAVVRRGEHYAAAVVERDEARRGM